ncbi:hypothetical protein B0H10DRAFT_619050 [Mycena sp. CBHHK59/15]|nr:hypothetical protein B0H10DRAFT_619050 [Mycena sp. CBHHK59/15]
MGESDNARQRSRTYLVVSLESLYFLWDTSMTLATESQGLPGSRVPFFFYGTFLWLRRYGAPLNSSALRIWYICQALIAHLTMTGVESVMMARVYALYHNNRWIACLFASLMFGETIAVIAGIVITLPHGDFDPAVLVTDSPDSFSYFAISALVSQAIILILTLVRYFQGQWAGTSLGTLLIRDGSIVYSILFCTTMSMLIFNERDFAAGMTEYAWYLAIISSVGCRLILNMQQLPSRSRTSESSSHRSSHLELTTLHPDSEAFSFHHHTESSGF